MNRKLWFRRFLLTLTLSSTILLFLFQSASTATTYNFYWSPNVNFGLPAYNTKIAFNDWIYLDSFAWNDFNATEITFTNIKMDGNAILSLTVKSQLSNITFTNLDVSNIVKYAVNGTGTQCMNILKPNTVIIDDQVASEGGLWNYSNNLVTISGATSTVELNYLQPSEGSGASGEEGTSATPTSTPPIIPRIAIPTWGYFAIFFALLFIAIGALFSRPTKKRGIRGVQTKRQEHKPRNLSNKQASLRNINKKRKNRRRKI